MPHLAFDSRDLDWLLARAASDLPASAVVSIWLSEPGRAASYERCANQVHYAASTMKLFLLVAAHRMHERGELSLDTMVPVHNQHRSAYDGSLFSLQQSEDQDDETWSRIGTSASLRTLARHAIVKSGNLATNLLLEHVGKSEVSAVLQDAGCSAATVLARGIEDKVARQAGMDNLVSAADLGRVMGAVAVAQLAAPQTCVAVERVLAAQEHRNQIPAGVPQGTYVANKTGWVDGIAHDVALVRPPDRPAYVLAVCTTADVGEDTLYELNASISAAVWEAWAT